MSDPKFYCRAEDLAIGYGKAALARDIALGAAKGQVLALIGPNGAGKSTMLNAIAGVWPVDSGSVIIDGEDITKLPEHKRAKYLGRVFQDPMNGTAADMEIEENLAVAKRRGQTRTLRWGITKKREKNMLSC